MPLEEGDSGSSLSPGGAVPPAGFTRGLFSVQLSSIQVSLELIPGPCGEGTAVIRTRTTDTLQARAALYGKSTGLVCDTPGPVLDRAARRALRLSFVCGF